jgi:hypothetical protein
MPALVRRGGPALIEAVASGLWKFETFGNPTIKAVIVHKITGTAMIPANRMMIRSSFSRTTQPPLTKALFKAECSGGVNAQNCSPARCGSDAHRCICLTE